MNVLRFRDSIAFVLGLSEIVQEDFLSPFYLQAHFPRPGPCSCWRDTTLELQGGYQASVFPHPDQSQGTSMGQHPLGAGAFERARMASSMVRKSSPQRSQ